MTTHLGLALAVPLFGAALLHMDMNDGTIGEVMSPAVDLGALWREH